MNESRITTNFRPGHNPLEPHEKEPTIVVNMGGRPETELQTESAHDIGALPVGAGVMIDHVDESDSDHLRTVHVDIGEIAIDSEEVRTPVSGIKGYTEAEVSGLFHLSSKEITGFDDRDPRFNGTYGKGVYLGANSAIARATLDARKSSDHFKYDVEVRGNVLVVNLNDVHGIHELAERVLSLEDGSFDEFIESPGGSGFSLLLGRDIDGVTYDAMILHAEASDGTIQSEAIVHNPSTTITITNSQHITT